MTNEPIRNEIDEDRAAVLLGLTRVQLRRLCEQSGLGPEGADDSSRQRLFTYHELYWLCRWVVRPVG
jgi:hypothetical protein